MIQQLKNEVESRHVVMGSINILHVMCLKLFVV